MAIHPFLVVLQVRWHQAFKVSRLIQLDADCAVNLRSGWRALTLPDSGNPIASYQHSAVFDDRMPIIHSNDAAAEDQPTRRIESGWGFGVNTSGHASRQQWKRNENSQNEAIRRPVTAKTARCWGTRGWNWGLTFIKAHPCRFEDRAVLAGFRISIMSCLVL
jgi:hypothetical protein